MKILFLHLSDAHLKDNTNLKLINRDAIVNSLSQIGKFDECVLVFSGDVVDSGDKNAYTNAGKLVGYIAKNINSFSNKIAKSINYLDLVAKILPNFRFMLQADEKKVITNVLYTYPNKLLYFMLKDINENHDKIIKDILKRKPKTRKGILVTEDMIARELQNQSMAYILSIYDFISMTSATEKTIGDLEKFDYNQNTNYKIQNLLMQENIANFKTFATRAEEIYDAAELNLVRQMVKLIVRKYFIYHDVEMHGDSIRLVDKFFGNDQRKNMQILQAKNKIIKK